MIRNTRQAIPGSTRTLRAALEITARGSDVHNNSINAIPGVRP